MTELEDPTKKRNEALLRAAHSSLCISWGTTVPYTIGKISAERIGYADIPCVVVNVIASDDGPGAVVPIVRQRVFAELAERGWDNEVVAFQPSVQRQIRRRKFVDENTASGSTGRNKFGFEYRFSFEIVDREFRQATFGPRDRLDGQPRTSSVRYAQLPDRRDS